jgi:hypothetical protein
VNELERTKQVEKAKVPSHIRKYILITMIHGERKDRLAVSREIIRDRLLEIFPPNTKIIICAEKHKNGGFHYHAGLHTYVSSKKLKEKVRTESLLI